MGEIKIFGYIIIAALALSAIVMPLVEVFFLYRERLMLGDALYNSSRVAAEASYQYMNMRNIDAVPYEEVFCDTFGDTFATAFGIPYTGRIGNTLHFKPNSPDAAYNNFTVVLRFVDVPNTQDNKRTNTVTATATSEYKFKHAYVRFISLSKENLKYTMNITRTLTMEITN
jgi:hypothetical protein